MNQSEIIKWLLQSDVAVQYQVHRDLLKENRTDLQKRILTEGWGAEFLSNRKSDGHWGIGFYQPKWISSHYTLLDIKNLNPTIISISNEQSILLVDAELGRIVKLSFFPTRAEFSALKTAIPADLH